VIDNDPGGLWCPRCGYEYRLGAVTMCPDCHVDLTNRPPEQPERPEPVDHDAVEYDLAEWGDQRRQAIELALRGADIPFGWNGNLLGVPKQFEADVDIAIDEIDEGVADLSGVPALPGGPIWRTLWLDLLRWLSRRT
jgi:hypothetical protein